MVKKLLRINPVSVPFNVELRYVRKRPSRYARKFIYEFDVYVNNTRILQNLKQEANSIDEIKNIIIKDFKRGIKKIY